MLSIKIFRSRAFHFYLTEVIHPIDSGAWKFINTISKKVKGLVRCKIWKIVCGEEVLLDANVLNRKIAFKLNKKSIEQPLVQNYFVADCKKPKNYMTLLHILAFHYILLIPLKHICKRLRDI